MRPAIDTDFEAECYLFPYPVNQELLQVRAEWQDSVAENKDDNPQGEEGTDLGFLKSAFARLRTVLDDMAPASTSASGVDKRARREVTADYGKMGALARCLLAYAWQKDDNDNTDWD